MEKFELHNKIVQQLRFHRISGLDEEECANNILSIVQKDWTKQCSCNPDDKTGETWCCNTCGKPTPRLSTELPTIASARIAEVEREMKEAKQFISDVMNFADGMKVLDGEALRVLKNTARRVLSDKPTQLPKK